MPKAKPTLGQLNLVSGDPAASIAFYRRLGVEIADAAVWRTATGTHHVNARSGEVDFELDSTAFAQIWNEGWRGRGDLKGRIVLGFRMVSREAVDEVYADLTTAGYAGLQAPYDAFWGARYAVVEDPDGIAVGLMSPISPDFKSLPPEI
ncbi:VOC family protein [Dongia deserti]|uniref:VOC family protein n=1 Tax=Dongia deserti TaxID=2268030 RepID=UPI000E653A4A|nr:VOC family protein [Dongia deserti]